jgi:hypothetical protein
VLEHVRGGEPLCGLVQVDEGRERDRQAGGEEQRAVPAGAPPGPCAGAGEAAHEENEGDERERERCQEIAQRTAR